MSPISVLSYSRRYVLGLLLAGFLAYPDYVYSFDQAQFNTALRSISDDNMPLVGVSMMERMVADGVMHPAMLAQFVAITGDVSRVEALLGTDYVGPVFEDPGAVVCDYNAEPAIDAIVAAAKNYKIVMLNEAHHVSRHRAFAMQLALALRKEGFSHLGAESFSPEVSQIMQSGVPDGKIGVYTAEPFFADFVRQAVRAGYEVFDYEQREDQKAPEGADMRLRTSVREQAQAGNIKRIIDSGSNNARFFIYAGYSHINQEPSSSGTIWMALRLKHLTGLKILSIDQVAGSSRPVPYSENQWVKRVLECHDQLDTFVLRGPKGELLAVRGVDISVVHPRPRDGTDPLTMNGYRHARSLSVEALSERTLVRAFLIDEPKHGIPMHQVIVPPGSDAVSLILPLGRYRLTRQSEQGEEFQIGELEINDESSASE